MPGPVGRVSTIEPSLTPPNPSTHPQSEDVSCDWAGPQSICGMRQITVCWREFVKEGKNFPRSHCCPVLGDQVGREGPADAPTLGRTDRGHLDLTIPGRGRRAWYRDAFVSSAASPFFKESSCCARARGEVGGGEEPSQASWRGSRRISVFS